MRDPLISIKASDMRDVLGSYGLEFTDTDYFEFMKKMRARRCINRTVVFTNTQTARKVSKNIRVVSNNVERFNRALKSIRMDLNHKNIRNITKDDKQYESLKIAAGIFDDFISTFSITDIDGGLDMFIRIGIEVMGKRFGLNKFNYYKDAIYEEFEARLNMRDDDDQEGTKKMYECYKYMMLEQAALDYKLTKTTEMVNFVFARMEADDVDAPYVIWVEAQFEGLSFLNAVPEPSQLHGVKALERYNRYVRKSAELKQDTAPTETITEDTRMSIMEARNKRLSSK